MEPNNEAIEQVLDRILTSREFQHSERMSRFLRFVVEHRLRGDQAPLKEYLIAVRVFDRGEDFDPRTDTIVRVEARRLRAKLKEYYAREGRSDPTIIELPAGGYGAVFRTRRPDTSSFVMSRKSLLGATALLIVAVAAWWATVPPGTGEAGSIVVLPFVNVSGAAESEHLSDGLTEEIISRLASVPELRVVARTSAFQFKGRAEDVRKIGRDLRVTTLLEGSVRQEGQKVRVTAQLVNVSDGLHLWSQIYDRELTGLLQIEEEISRAVADTLRTRLAPDGKGRATTNPRAHELYLRGRYFWHRMTPTDLKKSIEYMEQATALDPTYAAAYAGLADAYGFLANLELEPPWELLPKGKRAAQRALELDADSAEAHFVMGSLLTLADWNWVGAEREFRRALDLKPSLVSARLAYATLSLGPRRRYDQAVAELRQALDIDPLSVSVRTVLGQTYVYAGRPDEGIREVRDALILEPGFPVGGLTLALAYVEKRSYPEALKALPDEAGDTPYSAGLLGYTRGKLGNRVEAERVLHQLKTRFHDPWVPPVEVAGIYNGLGDTEQALGWLERGFQQRSTMMLFIIDDPRFRNLNSHPKFRSVLSRMGLGR